MKKTSVVLIPKKGRGVVATKAIKDGEVVIIDNLMLISKKRNNCDIIRSHVMEFDMDNDCIMLGEATLINHSFDPNCEALIELDNNLPKVMIVSIKNIKKNEELTINYGDSYDYKWTK